MTILRFPPMFRCSRRTSVACSFIRIAARTHSVFAPGWQIPPDFLVPRGVGARSAAPSASISARRSNRRNLWARPIIAPESPQKSQTRSFAASARQNATRFALNPRKDDDGNDMTLEMTLRAAKRLSDIMKKDANPNLALRIQVESGGCHGFQYLMSLVTIPGQNAQEWSSIVGEDDSILQYYPDDADPDTVLRGGPRIILDEPSLQLLKGSKVDFTKELIGSQFKVIDNPHATSSCGCGTSFDIKM